MINKIKRQKLTFLLWYGWVDVPLAAKVRQLYGWRKSIVEISRKAFEDRYFSPTFASASYVVSQEMYRGVSFNDFSLWEICKSSICDHLQRTRLKFPEDIKTIEEYFARGERYIRAFEAMFATERPDAIIVEQGFQIDMRAAVEVARRRGIRTIAIENSFLKTFFFMDDSTGVITNRHTLSRLAWDRIRARSINETDRQNVDDFIRSSVTTFKHGEKTSRSFLHERFGLPKDKAIALLLGQVATDASIVMDSPVFEDQVEFISRVADAIEKHRQKFHLVIRLHPKEAFGNSHFGVKFDNGTFNRLREMKIDQKEHLTIFHSDQVNTYELMEYSEFGLTLNSQSGFEMLLKQKPMIVAGDAFYSRKGFTWDISQQCQLECTIDSMAAGVQLSSEQFRDIQNFAYSLFFEHLYAKNLNECEDRIRGFFK